jgi:hypothetical protein
MLLRHRDGLAHHPGGVEEGGQQRAEGRLETSVRGLWAASPVSREITLALSRRGPLWE